MTERMQQIQAKERPALKERGGFGGLLRTIGKFTFGTETLQEKWDGFKAKFHKPERQAEVLQTAEPVAETGGTLEKLGVRLGRSVGMAADRFVGSGTGKVEGLASFFRGVRGRFKDKISEISQRRNDLGVVGMARSYYMDTMDRISLVGDKMKMRWKVAEMAQMKEQRTRLNAQYIKDQLEKKELLAKGTRRKDLPERLLTQKALRMRLRPIRETELLAKYELAQLREEASRVRGRIEGKQNVVAVLEAEKQARHEKEARRSNAALVLRPVTA